MLKPGKPAILQGELRSRPDLSIQQNILPAGRSPAGHSDEGRALGARLSQFRYMTFDVVGTLIDFEGGITACLSAIAAESGVALDGEAALSLYRAARYSKAAELFPDDLVRVYREIAPTLGLPALAGLGERFRDSARSWRGFPDSTAALAHLAGRYRLIAMTNARRWALEHFEQQLGRPFYATFTSDDTGTEKPDPAFFEQVFAFVRRDGGSKDEILHVAQSQYHDIGISRKLGLMNCWIERRHDRKGYGATIEPAEFTTPDFHFTSMAGLSDAVDAEAKLPTP